jgi:hypothetical protein
MPDWLTWPAAVPVVVLRSEWAPNSAGSSPIPAIHSETSRAYRRVVMLRAGPRRPENKNSPGFLLAALMYSSTG